MSIEALVTQLTPVELPLAQIFLDPNNPRFVTAVWNEIPEDQIDKEEIQQDARRRLIHSFDVDKLRMNMEVNGFLTIDRVIVRQFKPDKYVILEGNRRICAAQLLSNMTEEGEVVSAGVLESVKRISCMLYTGHDANAAWVFQGLRHIVGVAEWSAFNKAKLLVEQMENEGISLTDVGKRFGLTRYGAGQWVRGYRAFLQAQGESDYISEVDERSFPFFQEVFGRSSTEIREWMKWNDKGSKFEDAITFNEFISWLYPRAEETEDSSAQKRGEWERRRVARRDDLRTLSFLLREEPDLFQQFRAGAELESVYALALSRKQQEKDSGKIDPVAQVFALLESCSKVLENLPLKMIRENDLKQRLLSLIGELEKRIAYVKE